MARHLRDQGHICHIPDLIPANGAHGLIDLSLKLKSYIDAQVPMVSFALVGFSMGSLVCRHYLQRGGGLERATHFFSISGPHHGTLNAHIWPGKAARDMRRNSLFLNDLKQDISRLCRIDLHTYRTPFDLLIIPACSSKLPGANNAIVYAPFHHLMLRQDRVIKDIAHTLNAYCDPLLGESPLSEMY